MTMIDISAFSFDVKSLTLDPQADFIAKLPSGLSDRESLFAALSRELQFPSYFGKNWDAVSDCLRDLSWIKPHRAILLHEDLPPLEAKQVVTYLDVLTECVQTWKARKNHELVVVFPREVRDALANLAK
jgi:hypothetical protein